MRRPITIIGGGLCGLGLANGLRLRDVPVTLHEAGSYPRHRVCGEFLAGLEADTVQDLGVESCLADALPHRESLWLRNDRIIRKFTLPATAPGISRFALDARMARLARARGAELIEHSRHKGPVVEGMLLTCGRSPVKGGFHGLKAHWSGLETRADLELHLGNHCYAGLSRIENGAVNVCGLFRDLASGTWPSPVDRCLATLRSGGLGLLAERLEAAVPDESSFCAVSGLGYGCAGTGGRAVLGDRYRLIPPFTGNGMTLALESAALALPFVVAYAKGEADWQDTLTQCRKVFHRRFRIRR